jgi:hypothetical protein
MVHISGEVLMAERIVDVFLSDQLAKSYRISLKADYAISDEHFVVVAKQNMVQEGHPDEDFQEAKFVVRFV